MSDLNPIVSVLKDKLALIIQLERETNELLNTPVERVKDCLDRRQAVLTSLSETEKRLSEELDGRADLKGAIGLTCDIGGLSPELLPLFELSLAARAGIKRILKIEPAVYKRLEGERQSILKKIENLNISSPAAAEKYYRSAQTAALRGPAETGKTTV